jgi:uncharacterized protein YhaN
MRLSRLELLAFGPFRGLTLDFSAPGLHVVLGRNEAGKSTTLRAITGLLYGIDAKTPDAHVHKFADLRIGGVLEDGNGERIRVVRRKGNTNTLLNDRDQAVDESVMKKLLAGVSKETFVHAFGLTHEALAAGAQALLEGKGDLGESLFDASVGGGGEVQRLLAELKAEAERLYKPRGSALPLNDALKSFAEAQKAVREKESRPEAFLEQERGLDEVTKEREARIKTKAELGTRRARLERAQRRLPLERRHQRAIEKRTELGLSVEHVGRIEGLAERFAGYKHAVDQRRTLLVEAERLADRVTEAARRAGIDAHSDAESLRLDARKETRINGLLRDRTKLVGAIEAARTEIAKQERELARLNEAAGALPETRDGARPKQAEPGDWDGVQLASALERARNLGDIEARVATKRAQVERKGKELESKALADGLFRGTLEAFVALRVPSVASVERLEARVDASAQAIARFAERLADLEKEAASIEKQIACHAGDFAPPDAAVLHAARTARDEAWRGLREATEEARRSAEVEVERLLREADSVADRMIREADRVTALARLRSEAETNARQMEKVKADRAQAIADRAALDAELGALFAEIGIQPPHAAAFAEMGAWLDRHAQISDAFDTLRDVASDVLDDEQKIEGARHDLHRALAAVEGDGGGGSIPRLGELIAIGTRRLATIETARRAAAEAARAVVKVRVDLDERLAAQRRDEAALADVSTKLVELIAPLGVPVDASADEVNRSIEALRELFALADKRADVEARARGLDTEIRAFEADLERAIGELAPDLSSVELRDAAPMLFSRAAEARDNAQELQRLARELETEREVVLDEAERALVSNDPDATERALEELREQIEEADADLSRLTERIGGIRTGLEQMRGESNAAEAAGAAQIHLARVREHAERWCRVRLAAHLLSREIERYREENQGPLLSSSSAFFTRLTLGSFSGIKAGFDDKDRPCLRCVRADGMSEVDVSGLSDGTRDQLYLSLRLASLIRRAEVAETMPLVLDDVLIQLDDQRASAALTVLAEVARKMQVLFFTHHARLVDLARASVSTSELVVHELVSGPYVADRVMAPTA